jgi:hypothetical protein
MASADSPQTERPRDLGRYETSGPYEIAVTLNGRAREAIDAEVRQFIWEHYRGHRLAYVNVIRYSKEGEPSASSYFVEPEENSNWHVRVEIHRRLIDRRNTTQVQETNERLDAYALERVRSVGAERVQGPLTDSVPIPPASYRLKLLGKDRELLAEI